MRIAVLANLKQNAPPSERKALDAWAELDSPRTPDAIVAAFQGAGHEAKFFEGDLSLVTKLPAYAGVASPSGYTLIRITRVTEPDKIDAEKEKNIAQAMQQAGGQEQYAAYLASLKQKGDVKIHKDKLVEKKDKDK